MHDISIWNAAVNRYIWCAVIHNRRHDRRNFANPTGGHITYCLFFHMVLSILIFKVDHVTVDHISYDSYFLKCRSKIQITHKIFWSAECSPWFINKQKEINRQVGSDPTPNARSLKRTFIFIHFTNQVLCNTWINDCIKSFC